MPQLNLTKKYAKTTSSLAHARQTLRMLQDVSAGTRQKFSICGNQPKSASRASKTKTAKSKTNGIAKAKRVKSTKARNNWPSQQGTNSAMSSSSSAAGQADTTDAMDVTGTGELTESDKDVDDEYVRNQVLRSGFADWPQYS